MINRLILASNSPRRQDLLRQCGFEFDVFVRDFEEVFPNHMKAGEVAEYLAIEKNKHYRSLKPESILLTADTTVVHNEQVLNKPKDRAEAIFMLQALSGKTHRVICGVCISDPNQATSFTDISEVTFAELLPEEISHYVDTYQPFDKAGAYGIQEWIGMTKIKEIKGSFYNVMGLPTHRIYEILKAQFNCSPKNEAL